MAALIGAVLCAQPDSRVLAFDLATGSVVPARFDYQQGIVSAMDMSRDGKLLVEVGGSVLALWRLDGSGPVTQRVASGTDLRPQGFDTRGRLIVGHNSALSGLPMNPFIVDPSTGTVVEHLRGVLAAAVTPDPDRLIALFEDGTGGFYDLRRDARVPGIDIALPFVPTFAAEWGTTLLVANEGDLQGIDLRSGALVPPSIHQEQPIFGIAVDPGGKHFFTAEPAGFVPRSHTGARIGPAVAGADAAVSARHLVVSTFSGHLEVRDAATRRVDGPELPSITGLTNGLTLSADGRRLLVVGRDRTAASPIFRLATSSAIPSRWAPAATPSP